MKKLSNIVTSNQLDIHEDLPPTIKRIKENEFRKPYASYSLKVFEEIEDWISGINNNKLILDLGCGVGESSYHLGTKYPDCLVIGMDKSDDRITRNNKFKKSLPRNVFIVRADIIDLLRLFYENKHKYQIIKQYILYPNPYPKQKHYKLRWHGHPIFKTMMNLSTPVEVRSNWELYVREFLSASKLFGLHSGVVEEYVPEISITPFERKYIDSKHQLFKLMLEPL